jgi:hypothetical protein
LWPGLDVKKETFSITSPPLLLSIRLNKHHLKTSSVKKMAGIKKGNGIAIILKNPVGGVNR